VTGASSFDELAGRRVLVTGASSGIGAAVATGFGLHGAKVCIHYRSNAEGAEAVRAAIAAGGSAQAVTMQSDLSVRGAAARLVTDAATALGGLDLLVNNAGDMLERRKLETATDEHLDAIVDVNIRPVIAACGAAVTFLRGPSPGSIINVSSIAAHSGGSAGANLYAAAKGFIVTYTRALARELAPDGIRVNAVSPGIIATPLHARRTPEEEFAKFPARIPLGRVGQADDCVGAFLFLACNGLSRYLTGETIEVNGGQYMG
jgi:3-oxoacyl-[acyl-carrier protein] reductase